MGKASTWPKLPQVGSKLAQVGPMLRTPTWLKLGPCWPQIRIPSRPCANPNPPRSLPEPFKNPFKRLLPVRQAWAAGFGALEVPFGPPKPPTWTSKLLDMAPKRTFPGSKSFQPRPGGWGVASLYVCVCVYIYIYMYIYVSVFIYIYIDIYTSMVNCKTIHFSHTRTQN